MVITLSPDENPGDPGTLAGGFNERAENIKVISFLAPSLQRCGVTVHFDSTITYQQRVARANADGTDVLVAIAHNAGGGEGTVFLFCKSQSGHGFGKQDQAANVIGTELVAAGIAGKWGTYDEDVYECCAFNRDTVYIEVLFQDNARDAAKMREATYHHDVAEAVTRGLAATYGFTYVPEAAPVAQVNYRVYGGDGRTQVGAYNVLANAKAKADDVHGVVKDLSGHIVYQWTAPPAVDPCADVKAQLAAVQPQLDAARLQVGGLTTLVEQQRVKLQAVRDAMNAP